MSTQVAATEPITTTTKAPVLSFVAWLVIVLLATLAVTELKAPSPVAATASPADFSAERALVHVRAIASMPHPLGSDASRSVRQYLVAQLSSLGLNPQIFDGMGFANRRGRVAIATTHDVVGRLPGSANAKAILLMAHYDSVRFAPGAADDGAGVAAVLECVRALRAGPAVKNDLIVLFTDGEEAGLLGADAFASAHPWMKDVGLVLNFEARGNQGPAMLFETSSDNLPLVEAAQQFTAHPIGSSFFYSLYKLLPNDTDFTVFRAYKTPGLNFAFGENLDAYHSRLDTADALSLASLQHHGSYALGLTGHFGQMDLERLKTSHGDAVFFNWLGGNMIVYSERWVIPGEFLVTGLLIFAIVLNTRKSTVKFSRIALALIPSFALLLGVPIVLAVVNFILTKLLASRLMIADSAANSFLLAGCVLVGLCTAGWMFSRIRKRFALLELSLGGLLLVNVLSWLLALTLPAGSYLLFWPLLLGTFGVLVSSLRNKVEEPNAQAIAALACTAVAVLLFAPIIYLIYVFLTLQMITSAATGLLIALFVLVTFPVINVMLPQRKWRAALLVLLIAAFAAFGTGGALSHNSIQHPRRDSLLYSMNADNRSSVWISPDRFLDQWTRNFFPGGQAQPRPMPDYLAGLDNPVRSSPAPTFDLAPPIAEIRRNEKEGDIRKVEMHVKSQRQATGILLTFAKDVQVLSIKIGSREIVPTRSTTPLSINILIGDAAGTDLELTIRAPGATSFWLMDQSSGLPTETAPRPNDVMASGGSDMTFVCRKYSL